MMKLITTLGLIVVAAGMAGGAEPADRGAINSGLGGKILIADGPAGPIRGGESAVTDLVLADDGWVYGSTKATWGAANCHLFATDGKSRRHVLNVTEKLPGQTRVTDLEKGPAGVVLGCTSVDDETFDAKKPYDGGHVFQFDPAKNEFKDLDIMIAGDGIQCIALDAPRNLLYGVSYPKAHLFALDLATNKVQDYGSVNTPWRTKDLGRVSWRGVPKVLMIDGDGTVYFSGYVQQKAKGSSAALREGGEIYRLRPGQKAPELTQAVIPTQKGQDSNNLYENGIACAIRAPEGGFWCGTINDGFLFKFDPATLSIANKGKPCQGFLLKGLTYGDGGKLYGILGLPAEQQHLIRYDPVAGSIDDLGHPNAWTQLGAICTAKDGTILMAEDLRISYLFPYSTRQTATRPATRPATSAATSPATRPATSASPPFNPWQNPKLRPIQEYPFADVSGKITHASLWQDYPEVPEWGQRGRLIYSNGSGLDGSGKSLEKLNRLGFSLVHSHGSRAPAEDFRRLEMPQVWRIDGEMFFGDFKMRMLLGSDRPSAYSKGTDGYSPDSDWFRKFPLSMAASRILRDGQPQWEYWGSAWAMRRDINYLHPVSLQIRDATFREILLGEQMFDQPLGGRQEERRSLCGGVWWDNPGNVIESYDPYSMQIFQAECKKLFGAKYRAIFETWYAGQLSEARFKAKYGSPEAKELLYRTKYENWFYDPPRLISDHKDREMERWWNKFWADACAGYYKWQYDVLQKEFAPKMGRKHLFVGGNYKLCWPSASWDYYVVSKNIVDVMGPCETHVVYTNKEATGYKMALGASNGKPGGRWRSGRPESELVVAEAIATLGVITNPHDHLAAFQTTNTELFHNARPGGQVAVLYHLEDGLHHSEIANLCRLTDQIWRAGVPLEILTENHLNAQALKPFKVLVLPGFRFSPEEVAAIRQFAENGGAVVMIGDNRDSRDKQLSMVLCDIPEYTDGQAKLGKGLVANFGTQLVSQEQMRKVMSQLNADSVKLTSPADTDILVNVLSQPAKGLVSVHLVNFSGKEIKEAQLSLPKDFQDGKLVWVSPYGGNQALVAKDGRVTIPTLGIYGVLVACKDEAKAGETLKRNQADSFPATPASWSLGKTFKWQDIQKQAVDLPALKPGQKVAQLRQFTRTGNRRLDADVVTTGKGATGKPQDVQLKIHAIDIWAPQAVSVDKFAIVAVRESDGRRESVPIPMETVTATSAESEAREREVELPTGGESVRRDSHASWTPREPGRYQLYLSYRYASEPYQGKPDTRTGQKYPLADYFFSRPQIKIVYEDRLPCLVVDVE